MQNKPMHWRLSIVLTGLFLSGCSTSQPSAGGIDSSRSASHLSVANTLGIAKSVMPGRDELVRRALARNTHIQSLRKVASQADSLYRARKSGRQPELRWAYEESASGEDKDDLQLGLRIFPEAPWAWLSNRAAAEAMSSVALLDAQLAEEDLVYKVSDYYLEAQWMKSRLIYAGMAVENARSASGLNEALADAGQSTLGEGLKIKLQQFDADRKASTLQAEFDGLLFLLGAEVGLDPRALRPLIGAQDGRYKKDEPLSVDAASLIQQAVANSGILALLDQQHILMGLELKDDLTPVLPWLRHLQASWSENQVGGDDSWRLSGAISLPMFALFSGRGSLIEALDSQLETERNDAKNGLSAAVQEQYAKWVSADKQARDFAKHSDPMLRELLKEVELMGADEAITPKFMVEQQEVLLEAFETRADIIYARDQARLELRRLTGQLKP